MTVGPRTIKDCQFRKEVIQLRRKDAKTRLAEAAAELGIAKARELLEFAQTANLKPPDAEVWKPKTKAARATSAARIGSTSTE